MYRTVASVAISVLARLGCDIGLFFDENKGTENRQTSVFI